jgi:hypothetical protein
MLNAQCPTLDTWGRAGPGPVKTKQWLVVRYYGEIGSTAEVVVVTVTVRVCA